MQRAKSRYETDSVSFEQELASMLSKRSNIAEDVDRSSPDSGRVDLYDRLAVRGEQ